MIKKIHLIWLGKMIPNSKDRPYLNRVLKWHRINPDYEVNLWFTSKTLGRSAKAQMGELQAAAANAIVLHDIDGDDKLLVGLDDSFASEVFNKLPNYGAASDILRVAILIKFGGIYFDTDIEPVAPLGGLVAPYHFLVNRPAGGYSNDILYSAIVKHDFFIKYRANMIENYGKLTPEDWYRRRRDRDEKNASTQLVTGPGALTDTILAWGLQPTPSAVGDPIVFPKDRVRQEKSDESWLDAA
jgi:hypothetical protein